jgi:hypothetical protein
LLGLRSGQVSLRANGLALFGEEVPERHCVLEGIHYQDDETGNSPEQTSCVSPGFEEACLLQDLDVKHSNASR